MGPFDKDSGEYGVAAPRSTTEIMPGFIGYGLRRVSDDAYIQIARPSCAMGALLGYCNGGFEQLSFEKAGDAGEKYTIDVIDYYSGGWGWFCANVSATNDFSRRRFVASERSSLILSWRCRTLSCSECQYLASSERSFR